MKVILIKSLLDVRLTVILVGDVWWKIITYVSVGAFELPTPIVVSTVNCDGFKSVLLTLKIINKFNIILRSY